MSKSFKFDADDIDADTNSDEVDYQKFISKHRRQARKSKNTLEDDE